MLSGPGLNSLKYSLLIISTTDMSRGMLRAEAEIERSLVSPPPTKPFTSSDSSTDLERGSARDTELVGEVLWPGG